VDHQCVDMARRWYRELLCWDWRHACLWWDDPALHSTIDIIIEISGVTCDNLDEMEQVW